MKLSKPRYNIIIPETSSKEILKRSVDNIRFKQLKDKVNLEAEIEHARKYIGSPMPKKEHLSYLKEIGKRYMQSKKLVSKLW